MVEGAGGEGGVRGFAVRVTWTRVGLPVRHLVALPICHTPGPSTNNDSGMSVRCFESDT